jgi:hypothetical protein
MFVTQFKQSSDVVRLGKKYADFFGFNRRACVAFASRPSLAERSQATALFNASVENTQLSHDNLED